MRIRVLGGLLVAGLLISGCGASHPTETHASKPDAAQPARNPSWAPLVTAAPASVEPAALQGLPGLHEVDAVARGGPSRVDGETFALHVAQLLLDVRSGISGERAVGAVASNSLAPAVRAYLVADIKNQLQLRTERALDTRRDIWLRSLPVGSADKPDVVKVEIVFDMVSAPLHFAHWMGHRYDVAREHGIWKLVGYSDASSGPMVGRNMTRSERLHFLTGPGWRRIPPA